VDEVGEELRRVLSEKKEALESRYGIHIYIGYDELGDFLGGRKSLNPQIYKRCYEFWTYLIMLESMEGLIRLGESYFYRKPRWKRDLHQRIYGSTFRGKSIWCEPYMPGYDPALILSQYDLSNEIRSLLEITQPTIHCIPDFIVFNEEYTRLYPFTQLTRMFVYYCPRCGGEVGGWNERCPSCGYSMLERMRGSWGSQLRRFPERRNIEWLVECKEKGITREDLSQFIWYILAYKVPSALIFQGSLDSLDQRDILENLEETLRTCVRQEELENLGEEFRTRIKVLDNFRIGDNDTCLHKIREELTIDSDCTNSNFVKVKKVRR